MSAAAPSSAKLLELMASRIQEVGLYRGTDPHHSRGVAVPPTVIGAFDWARGKTRPDWRTREDGPLWGEFHAACATALHRLAAHVADDRLEAPDWWHAGQLAWESHVITVWGEFHTAEEVRAALRATAQGCAE